MIFFPVAYANGVTGGVQSSSPLPTIIMLVVFFAIFYFLLIRPQSKRAKEQRNLIANLTRGDELATSGGLVGRITDIEDNFLVLEIANNVLVRVQRTAVTSIFPKGTLKF